MRSAGPNEWAPRVMVSRDRDERQRIDQPASRGRNGISTIDMRRDIAGETGG